MGHRNKDTSRFKKTRARQRWKWKKKKQIKENKEEDILEKEQNTFLFSFSTFIS